MVLLGVLLTEDAAMGSSLPWSVLQSPGTGKYIGRGQPWTAPLCMCSEGARRRLSNIQTPGKYLLDGAFRENTYWHKSSPHACCCPSWLTFVWHWWRRSHFACTCNAPFLAFQSVFTRRNFAVWRRVRVQGPSCSGDFLRASNLPGSGADLPLCPFCGSGTVDRPFPKLLAARWLLQSSMGFLVLVITQATCVITYLVIHNLY